MNIYRAISEINMQEKIERQAIIKSILDPLFKKLNSYDPPLNEKRNLNLASADGISLIRAVRYTDNQFFIDVAFCGGMIAIEGLFFDGRKMEIGGFGTEDKPLTLGLVKLLEKHINELTRDYNIIDLINEPSKPITMR